jgi:ribosomal protein L3 glutamine methyltransferase
VAQVPDPYADAAGELATVRDLLRFAVTRFGANGLAFGHGFPDARSEAANLIGWALDLPHADLDQYLDARLTREERAAIAEILRGRAEQRIPSPYLTREAWLGDYRFHVDERVLIPRSFIADLLSEGLAPWIADRESVGSALDVCTGSGCLAILLAEAFSRARVVASDVSEDALAVARMNVADYALGERVELVRSDLLAGLADRRFDLIVSNPPYVDAASMAALPPEYGHEPPLALAGGPDGLDLVRKLLRQAAAHLTPEGLLVVEIGHNRAVLEAAYPSVPFTWLETHAGDEFVFLLRRDELPD